MVTFSDQLNNMTKVFNFNLSSLNDLFRHVSEYTYIYIFPGQDVCPNLHTGLLCHVIIFVMYVSIMKKGRFGRAVYVFFPLVCIYVQS